MKSSTRRRKRLHENNPHCHWCGILTVEGGSPRHANAATLDHVYSRLDPRRASGPSPVVLACYSCNQRRSREEHARGLDRSETRFRSPRQPIAQQQASA